MRVFPLLAGVGLCAAVAACGSERAGPRGDEASTQAAGKEPGPCDLLTPADVQGVLGERVLAGDQVGYECQYNRPPNADGMRVPAVRLRLEFANAAPAEHLERYAASMREGLGGTYQPSAVSGVGDAAAWDGDALTFATAVNGRSAFVLIQPIEVEAGRRQELARALADRALARLR